MKAWRVINPCGNCPFNKNGAGLKLRKSLGARRWQSILRGLELGQHFTCHKTTRETGNGSELVCAGSIEWSDNHGCSQQYVRICERLEYFDDKRRQESIPNLS